MAAFTTSRGTPAPSLLPKAAGDTTLITLPLGRVSQDFRAEFTLEVSSLVNMLVSVAGAVVGVAEMRAAESLGTSLQVKVVMPVSVDPGGRVSVTSWTEVGLELNRRPKAMRPMSSGREPRS